MWRYASNKGESGAEGENEKRKNMDDYPNIKVQFNGSLHRLFREINIDECLNVNMNIHPFKSTYLNLMDSS